MARHYPDSFLAILESSTTLPAVTPWFADIPLHSKFKLEGEDKRVLTILYKS